MSNSKHTPGPCHIDKDLLKRTDEIHIVRKVGNQTELMAKVCGDYGFALKAAAAPRMHEFISKLVNFLDHDGEVPPGTQEEMEREMRDILKATGGAE